MSRPFTITTPATSIELDASRTDEVAYTVFNVSGRRLVGRALIHLPDGNDATSKSWFTIQDEIERVFPEDGTQHFTVTIAVPPDVPAGSYLFRFDMVGVEDVNELHVAGSSVAVQVPEPTEEEKPRCRWCIPVAVAAMLLLVTGGVIAFLLTRGGDDGVEIPDVRNLAPDQATGILLNACEPAPCFSVIPSEGPSLFVDSGLVSGTNPAPGSLAEPGSEVTLIVSTGPAFLPPDLPIVTFGPQIVLPGLDIEGTPTSAQ